ncbi:MAG: UPF0104 family protein [Dokdonella sp.]|uniref:UPF0104 family protein n=1 Tax=Dokdonella sp. TaxID=2291710 RepID=UPI00326346E3
MNRAFRALRWLAATGVVLIAGNLLWRQFQSLSVATLHDAWIATPMSAIVLSVIATAISFACLAAYEWFATTRAVPGRVPTGAALLVGVTAHAIANTLGFHAITAGALRYRAYRRFGLGVADVTRIVALVGVCVAAGVVSISGLATLAVGMPGDRSTAMALMALALLVCLAVASVVAMRTHARTAILVRRAIGLCVVGTIEMAASIGALYVLIPTSAMPDPANFVLLFVSATLLGIVSHVPGGIGVFEAAILAAMPSNERAGVLIALLAYRAIYNLLPFLLAVATEICIASSRSRHEEQGINSTVDTSASTVAGEGAGEPA